VLLTGHTGFKGSWLALWLLELGAKVTGLALRVENATDDPQPSASVKGRAPEPEAPVQRRSRVIEGEPPAEVQAPPPVDEPPFEDLPLVRETLAAFEAKLGQVNRRPRAGGGH